MQGKRGLCFACYFDRDIRAQYPADGGRELTDAEVEAIQPIVFGDVGPGPPGEYVPPAEAKAVGDFIAHWQGIGEGGWYDLHPDTDPAAVELTHLWLVESSVCFHGADADAISDAVCLPVWNVKRHLFALGLGPDPRKPAAVKTAPNYGTVARRPA